MGPSKSTLIRRAVSNFYRPSWWIDSLYPYLVKQYARLQYKPDAPVCHIMAEDWDNLVILDACRYDQFETHNTVDGRLEARTSLGSATHEFLPKNFEGTTHHDTVYVTANPMYRTKDLNDVFHAVVDVWNFAWDDDVNTVRPEAVVEAARDAYESYPNKRLIVHFMQPHYPFIGDSADDIGSHAGFELTYREAKGEVPDHDSQVVWDKLDAGTVSEELVWKAYDENLEVVLPYVEYLVDAFDEKTVLTSDHGNLVRERLTWFGPRESGHPPYTYCDSLRKVPWLVVEADTRKRVRSEQPVDKTVDCSSDVAERLADLGYAEV